MVGSFFVETKFYSTAYFDIILCFLMVKFSCSATITQMGEEARGEGNSQKTSRVWLLRNLKQGDI